MSPTAKIVLGYAPIMPSFQGQLSEEQILDLIAYVKSLSKEQGASRKRGNDEHGHAGTRDETPQNYLNAAYGWKSWLFTLDHKRIAILVPDLDHVLFLRGRSFAALMRIQLLEPQGALVQPATYNKLFTLHGSS